MPAAFVSGCWVVDTDPVTFTADVAPSFPSVTFTVPNVIELKVTN